MGQAREAGVVQCRYQYAGGEPRRFDRFTVGVSMASVTDSATAENLLRRAKELCTVSHTLNADITLAFTP